MNPHQPVHLIPAPRGWQAELEWTDDADGGHATTLAPVVAWATCTAGGVCPQLYDPRTATITCATMTPGYVQLIPPT